MKRVIVVYKVYQRFLHKLYDRFNAVLVKERVLDFCIFAYYRVAAYHYYRPREDAVCTLPP